MPALLIGEEYFDYRAYDYKGGFYICTQIAFVDKKEKEQHVAFDQIKEQYLYLMHYVPIGRAKHNSWEIQNYRMYCLELPSLESLDTINYETIANDPEWKLSYEVLIGGKNSMPSYMVLWNTLTDGVKELNQNHAVQPSDMAFQWARKFNEGMEKESPFNAGLVDELKAKGQYDTIVKTDYSTLYMNTDYECYEILDDPEVFYVSAQEYYPDGKIKSKKYFLQGVYNTESLLFGPYASWNEKGEIIHADLATPFFYSMEMGYYFGWMDARHYIDLKTGKGKPVMKINAHIDPHAPSSGALRLEIQTDWQIQTDGDDDEFLSVLIKNDNDTETVFIFKRSSKIIWDKFTRYS